MKKFFTLSIVIILIFNIILPTNYKVFAGGLTTNSLDVVKELTKKEYNGRQTGTLGYEKAVKYIENQLKTNGVVPLLDENSYRQEYETNIATLKDSSLKIDQKEFILMKDYMVFSRSGSINKLSMNNIYYAGTGQEKDYLKDVSESLVIFKWNDINGKFAGGIVDRIEIAKRYGAKVVFIVANGELEVGNYEHPLNGEDIGIPVVYITKDMAKNILGVPDSDNACTLSSKNINLNLNIIRENAKGINLIGVIPGRQENKAILITTNLDGFGFLPDGRFYESAKSSAVSVGMLIDLVKYYNKNTPEYTLILGFVGSKWTGNDGIKELCDTIDFNNIVFSIDLYAMGGTGNLLVNYIDDKNKGLVDKINKGNDFIPTYNPNDFGNALTSSLSSKSKSVLLIRDQGTWIADSLEDKFDKINVNNYIRGLDNVKIVIDNIISYDRANKDSFSYNNVSINKEYIDEVKREITYKESKYFKVYFDKEFESSINDKYLREIDIIYERISKFNYYPYIGEKVKLLNLKDGNEAAIIAGRSDLMGNSEKAGGGFASFSKPVIYCRQPALGTVAHELNHLLVEYKGYGNIAIHGFKNSVAQESQGQSFLVHYNNQNYVTDVKTLINEYLNCFESPDVIDIARNYEINLNWESYIHPGKDYKGNWQNTYHTLGSIYTYIKYTYGENTSRRAMYRVYELQPDRYEYFEDTFIRDLSISIDEFLDSWSSWMLSSGKNVGNKVENYINIYNDKLIQYDYQKIYTVFNITKNSNELTSNKNINIKKNNNVEISKVPIIESNQKQFFEYKEDGNKYVNIDYIESISNSSCKIYALEVAIDSENVYIKIKFNVPGKTRLTVFLQEDTPGLKETSLELASGDNTVIIKLNKKELGQYKAGLAINFGNRNFIFIDKIITDTISNIMVAR